MTFVNLMFNILYNKLITSNYYPELEVDKTSELEVDYAKLLEVVLEIHLLECV